MPRRIPTRCDAAQPLAHRLTQPPNATPAADQTELTAQVQLVVRHWRDAAEHTEQTRTRMSEIATRFSHRMTVLGITRLDAVTPAEARAFVLAPTWTGASPEVATQHARRTALRTLFRTARLLGLTTGDPTLDLALPSRGTRTSRPLSDDEVILCRASAQLTRGAAASARITAWALGESGAVSSEISAVRIQDLDDPANPRSVNLPGTRRHDPRTARLTPWASTILQQRVRWLLSEVGANPSTLLAYGGAAPPGAAKAQASVCNALREVLHAAGLHEEPDVRPASLRNWVGRTAYDAGTSIEGVARLLGLRSLDAAAEDIALDWRATPTGHGAEPKNPDQPTVTDEHEPWPQHRRRHCPHPVRELHLVLENEEI